MRNLLIFAFPTERKQQSFVYYIVSQTHNYFVTGYVIESVAKLQQRNCVMLILPEIAINSSL